VTDTANQSDTEAQSVTVTTGGAPCTSCQAGHPAITRGGFLRIAAAAAIPSGCNIR